MALPDDADGDRTAAAGAADRAFGARFRPGLCGAAGDRDARRAKRGGAPTVASRWLQRLAALLGEEPTKPLKLRGDRYRRSRPRTRPRSNMSGRSGGRSRRRRSRRARAACRSPRSRRWSAIPTRSTPGTSCVSSRSIRSAVAPDYALRGSLIHDALGKFVDEWRGPFDRSARGAAPRDRARDPRGDRRRSRTCTRSGRSASRAIARWFVDWEAERDGEIATRHAEIGGELTIEAPAGPFRLRGRADRIDLRTRRGARNPRLQDRHAAVGDAGPRRLRAAARRSRRRWRRPARSRGSLAGRPVAKLGWIGLGKVGRGEPFTSAVEKDWTADGIADEVLSQRQSPDRRLRRSDRGLCVAGAADVRDPLREPLRPSRARARMGRWSKARRTLAWLPAGRSA